ncbi:hypothetical protein [Pseudomonas fluorescens]|uniref:Uncharacterized protein n=1 Tax=Pseudomonas fluorescens TaxID=294 RepID=A0A5E7HAH7_PSEFL|nr:hypothetical protein [Pseudomonas fluorescens]VVO61044.1 hypothetical protein PS880_00803 [Pseudomonas fluorescens]
MNDNLEGATDVELDCPNCGIKLYFLDGRELRKIHSIAHYSGQTCAGCGHVVSESDVESAMKSVIYELVKKSFRGGSG